MKVVRQKISGTDLAFDRLECGGSTVTCIPDIANIAWPATALFGDLTPHALAHAETTSPAGTVHAAEGTIGLSFNSYLIETPQFTALIDCGVGNDKERPDRPAWHRRNGRFLEALAALGVSPEQVDIVINTHLHADHVGWNTRLVDGAWQPTFPSARYVVCADELDHWMAVDQANRGEGTLHGAFADSIRPILDTVGFDAVAADKEIAEGLRLLPAPGHSPGMVAVMFSGEAGAVIFPADAIHHPLQLSNPNVASNFCENPRQAFETRQRLLAEAQASDAIVAPYHYPAPVFGRVKGEGSTFRFSPLAVEESERPATKRATQQPEEN